MRGGDERHGIDCRGQREDRELGQGIYGAGRILRRGCSRWRVRPGSGPSSHTGPGDPRSHAASSGWGGGVQDPASRVRDSDNHADSPGNPRRADHRTG